MSDHFRTPPPTVAPPLSLPEAGNATRPAVIQWQCTRCGSTDLASAYTVDYADERFRPQKLAPRALKLRKIARMLRPFLNLVTINAQVCRNCGYVMLEVNPDEFATAEEKYGRR